MRDRELSRRACGLLGLLFVAGWTVAVLCLLLGPDLLGRMWSPREETRPMDGHNPKLYREMAQPFESSEAAQAAATAFFEELKALRQKHRIANVYTILCFSAIDSDGEEREFLIPGQLGDELRAEGMTAFAYGMESEARAARTAKIIARAKKRAAA